VLFLQVENYMCWKNSIINLHALLTFKGRE
jgi:hypothetical protein